MRRGEQLEEKFAQYNFNIFGMRSAIVRPLSVLGESIPQECGIC